MLDGPFTHVTVFTDNQAVMYLLRKMYAMDPHINSLLCQLMSVILNRSLILYPRWISTTANVIADRPSRDFPIPALFLQQNGLNSQMSLFD